MANDIWVEEVRESPRSRWEPQQFYETRKEAREHCWAAVPPAEIRIVKYVRVEPYRSERSPMSKPTDVPESTKLKPCPFCGGEASPNGKVCYSDGHEAWFADGTPVTEAFYVNCMFCGCNNRGLIGHQTQAEAIASWNQRTPAASPVAPPESTRSRAELLTDFVIAHGNKYSPLRDTPEIQAALTVSKEAYETHRVHDFTTAHRESIIAGLANLLASPVAGGSGLEKQAPCDLCGKPMKRSGAGMHVHFADDRRCENRCLPELLRVQPSAEGWVKVTPETMPPMNEVVIIAHYCGKGTGALTRDLPEWATWFASYDGKQWMRVDGFLRTQEGYPAPFTGDVRKWKPMPAAEEERSSL